MAVAAPAALPVSGLPAYEVLIACGSPDRSELCAALAVELKELPLRLGARVLSSSGDPFAEELGIPGARSAAVLVMGAAAPGASYALEQLYPQLLERCGSRLLVVFSAEPLLAVEPTAAVSFAAFRTRLRERHRTRVLPAEGSLAEQSRAVAGFVCALLCEELALHHPLELERLFAEPEDASPARLTELLTGASPDCAAACDELLAGTLEAAGAPPTAAAAPGEAPVVTAPDAPAEAALDPLREPARARALEQRREGLRAFALGEDAVAIRHLRGALEQLPLDAPSGYWLARLLLAEGGRAAVAEASRTAQRAARVAASAGRAEAAALAHAAAARAEAELGHPQQAEQQARAAVACAPWLAEPWVELACQCARRGEIDAAERAMREAFQREPRSLLRLNHELPLRGASDLYRSWKGALRAELVAAVCAALDVERRVSRLLGEESGAANSRGARGSATAAVPGGAPERALADPSGLPLLDLLALGRQAAERTLGRLIELGRQLRASAQELGAVAGSEASGELLPLRLPEEATGGGRGRVVQVLNWLYDAGERVACGRPVLRYEVRDRRGRSHHTLTAPRTGVLTRIAVASGALPPGEPLVGTLRVLSGSGVELADRLQNSRAEEAELQLGARRAERESAAAGSRAVILGVPAVALMAAAVAAGQGTALSGGPIALCFGLAVMLALPALLSGLRTLRERARERSAQQRLRALGAEISASEHELARLWDELRLFADRFARAVGSFEDGLPAAPLFDPAPHPGARAAAPGALLRPRPGEGGDALELDDALLPPELAAQLPPAPAPGRAALYRVTESGARARAARWASYFPPAG